MRSCSVLLLSATLALSLLGPSAFAWLSDTTTVDCIQSQWSEWIKVGYNTRLRSRVILRHPYNGGVACGPNDETQPLPPGERITPQETARAFDTFFLRRQTTVSRNPTKERDLLVILDESGSIGHTVFEDAKEGLARLLGYICPGIGPTYPYHQVAFMTFSSSFTEHFDFNDYGNYLSLRNAISQVTYQGGSTNTHSALDYAREHMFNNGDFSVSTKGLRPGSMKEVLLITDGHPNYDSLTEAAAQELQTIGVDVFALGIGSIDQNHMEQLVSHPAYRHIFHLNNFDDFHTMVDTVEAQYNILAGNNNPDPCVSFNPWPVTGRRRR